MESKINDVHIPVDKISKNLYTSKAAELLEFFSRRHSIELVKLLSVQGPMRFSDILNSFDMSTKTLTSRLRTLETYGFIQRIQYMTIPPRVEYTALKAAKQICSLLELINNMHVEGAPHPIISHE